MHEPPLEAFPQRRQKQAGVVRSAAYDKRELTQVLTDATCERELLVGNEDRVDLTGW